MRILCSERNYVTIFLFKMPMTNAKLVLVSLVAIKRCRDNETPSVFADAFEFLSFE